MSTRAFLNIFTLEFRPYYEVEPEEATTAASTAATADDNAHVVGSRRDRRVSAARHHIDKDYTGSSETPLLDKIFKAQWAPDSQQELGNLLCALFGRTFFMVNQRDGWQVLTYLVGVGGTGKSLLLNILQSFFPPCRVGYLAPKRDANR